MHTLRMQNPVVHQKMVLEICKNRAKLIVSANGSVHESANDNVHKTGLLLHKMNKHITINQVADEAGVSIQTVSRVINDRYDVSAETRQRVQEAITRLGYQPNAIARGLASRRSRTLGIVAYDFTDFFFTQVVTGAEQEARAQNYFFMLGSTNCGQGDEPKYLRLLTERHVEGVLFARAGSHNDNQHLQNLQKTGVPVVTTGYYLPDASFTVIDINNTQGGSKAVDFLIQNGHRQIAMITGPEQIKSVYDRSNGYRQALERAGILYDPDLVVEGNWLHRSGYQAMNDLLAAGKKFSAVFTQNDRMAIGAISALSQAGLHVPEDISIVGYDDVPEAEFASTPLTTVRQPMEEVGQIATRLLINHINNPDAAPTQILLDTELIIRSSVAPRKGSF